jgi:hypothetical protein
MTIHRTHGIYELVRSVPLDGRMVIRRRDPDHRRTVAFVDTLDEWNRFVTALNGGADEVAAVHAIDA